MSDVFGPFRQDNLQFYLFRGGINTVKNIPLSANHPFMHGLKTLLQFCTGATKQFCNGAITPFRGFSGGHQSVFRDSLVILVILRTPWLGPRFVPTLPSITIANSPPYTIIHNKCCVILFPKCTNTTNQIETLFVHISRTGFFWKFKILLSMQWKMRPPEKRILRIVLIEWIQARPNIDSCRCAGRTQ